jgi:response regulator RpfG family c-di-GMP phosphodiesterase
LKTQILALLELDENSVQVVESLKNLDRRITVCKKFTKAIEILEKSTCALIISDVHLENGGNVFDFLRWAKANPLTKDTPFVLLSCKPTKMAKYVEDGVRTTARLLGADLFLTYEHFDAFSFCGQIEPLLSKNQITLERPTKSANQMVTSGRHLDHHNTNHDSNHKLKDHKETE